MRNLRYVCITCPTLTFFLIHLIDECCSFFSPLSLSLAYLFYRHYFWFSFYIKQSVIKTPRPFFGTTSTGESCFFSSLKHSSASFSSALPFDIRSDRFLCLSPSYTILSFIFFSFNKEEKKSIRMRWLTK